MAANFDSLIKSAVTPDKGSDEESLASLSVSHEIPQTLIDIRTFLGDESALSSTERRIKESGLDETTKEQLDRIYEKILKTQDSAKDFLRDCFQKLTAYQAAFRQKEHFMQLLGSMGVDEKTSNDIYQKIISDSILNKEIAAVQIEEFIESAVKTKKVIEFLGKCVKELNLPAFDRSFLTVIEALDEVKALVRFLDTSAIEEEWAPSLKFEAPEVKQSQEIARHIINPISEALGKYELRDEINPVSRLLKGNLNAEAKVKKLGDELLHLANEIQHVRTKLERSKFLDLALTLHLFSMEEEARAKQNQLEYYRGQLISSSH